MLPEIRLELSNVADYRRLATHVEAHGFCLGQLWKRYVSPEEALRDWYEYRYAPIAEMIREERILDSFSGRTELDLYLWIFNHRERLAREDRDEAIPPRGRQGGHLEKAAPAPQASYPWPEPLRISPDPP